MTEFKNEISEPAEVVQSVMDWRSRVLTENPFESGKTKDPEARDFSRAVTLFREGIQAARGRDLQKGREKVAAAYLLDLRVGRACVPFIPPGDTRAEECLLDMGTLLSLLQNTGEDKDVFPLDGPVLQLMLSLRTGNTGHNQSLHAAALMCSGNLIEMMEGDETLESDPHVLDGCLSRVALHNLRSEVYISLNNFKDASKELTKALRLDPGNTILRAKRVMLSYFLQVQACQSH